MKRNALHFPNNEFCVPPLAKAACTKDLHNKTATVTLNNKGTSDPFPVTSGGWQGGTATTMQCNNTITACLAPAITK